MFLFSCDDITNITEVIELEEEFYISLYRAEPSETSSFIYALGNYEYYLSHYSWTSAWNPSNWNHLTVDSIFTTEDTLWMSRFGASQIKFFGTQNGIDFVQHTWVKP